jgi:predicted 2-oxoglutarate/Fe(II)-dependent dioxygenase YbiX
MSSIQHQLAALLSHIQRPGDFYAEGCIELYTPRIEVDGVGPLALPLLPMQAEQLVAAAEPAPYGRGERTLVDTEVRRTWQIGAERVHIGGRHWQKTLQSIVAKAAAGLGVEGRVEAELYKLLVYDQGSFFVDHRDTEKAPGMFATLVIVLPSQYSGGELVIRHGGREARLDLSGKEPHEAAFAAFYADCVHEVLPITSGCRPTLVYNLLRRGDRPLPTAPDREAEARPVADLLRGWAGAGAAEGKDEDSSDKLVYPLEHAYTPAEVAFDTLKRADAAVAATLATAARAAGCECHLALLSIKEEGSAEYYGGGYRRWDEPDQDDFEVDEVFEHSQTLSEWRLPDGSRPQLGILPFSATELCPPSALEQLEPDDELFHEATGNEGASFERTYHRTAVVLWPRANRLAVIAEGEGRAPLVYLTQLAQQWVEAGASPDSPLWDDAHTFAGYLLRDWPDTPFGRYRASQDGDTALWLITLAVLGDAFHIRAFLGLLADDGPCLRSDNEAMASALEVLLPEQAQELLEAIVARNTPETPGGCAGLLARVVAAGLGDDGGVKLLLAAARLIEALPKDAREPGERYELVHLERLGPELAVDLLSAAAVIDADLATRALEVLLASPKTYPMDGVLVPAAVTLTEAAAGRPAPVIEELRAKTLSHLRRRIAEPLEPPKNWQRHSEVTCSCEDCAALSRFLADPEQQVWRYRAAEARRAHLTRTIRKDGCEVNCTTERRGRPYALVCTKNQARYEQRVEQRKQDLADAVRLETDFA